MFWPSFEEGYRVNVLKPTQRAMVITLLERITPQREIARITGIDRKTIRSYHQRWLADLSNSPGVATGSEAFHHYLRESLQTVISPISHQYVALLQLVTTLIGCYTSTMKKTGFLI
jgi:hypothetical protein